MKHYIWGETVPGNSGRSKLEDMNIDYKAGAGKAGAKFVLGILRYWTNLTLYKDMQSALDSHTYFASMEPGFSEKTYEDKPFVVPYLVEGSDTAVIVAPGGGYAFLGNVGDESSFETVGMARYLNEHGHNAFVLNYRYNPYKFPVPLLDMQRAIRYVKFHAEEYGIDPSKVGIVGFSAGGYQVGGFLHLVQGTNLLKKAYPDYETDAIDAVDDTVNNAGLLYPLTDFNWNKACLYSTMNFNPSKDREAAKRALEDYNLCLHLHDLQTPEFVAHGKKDMLISYQSSIQYDEALDRAGVPHEFYEIPDANHNFTPDTSAATAYVYDQYIAFLDEHMK